MWVFWATAFLITCVGCVCWFITKRIVVWEWLVTAVVAFAIAGICQLVCVHGMTDDLETVSGRIVTVQRTPAWVEYYEYAVYRTEMRHGTRMVSDGKGHTHSQSYTYTEQVFDHWAPSRRQHAECWNKGDDLGRGWDIGAAEYAALINLFGKETSSPGSRSTWSHASRMLSGDPLDYHGQNVKGWVQPVTQWRAWENRVKAAPSVFSFPPVPPGIKVFDYPANSDPFSSNRLLGTAQHTITTLAWDQMNARLGGTKKINLIAVGFGPSDSSIAEQQRSKWIGGRKNDLVLCYGGPDQFHPSWAKVFGWSDSDACKYQLQTLVLEQPMNNQIIPLIEHLVQTGYTIKNWHDFDYLSVEPPMGAYVWFFIVLAGLQAGLWAFFALNDEQKTVNVAEKETANA